VRITWLAALLLPVWGCGARSTDAPGRGPKESGSAAIAAAAKTACIPEGSKFFAKSKVEACCSGLVAVSAEDVPRSDYRQDDYPPGCGPKPATPPDLMICVACGDGVCGLEEHFCNCPADCASGKTGGL